ncbi:hypothetical protein P8452_66237 [Trifolium repens]|nr:hypothetical protein P8452_66237 [Trifolium repens]
MSKTTTSCLFVMIPNMAFANVWLQLRPQHEERGCNCGHNMKNFKGSPIDPIKDRNWTNLSPIQTEQQTRLDVSSMLPQNKMDVPSIWEIDFHIVTNWAVIRMEHK